MEVLGNDSMKGNEGSLPDCTDVEIAQELNPCHAE